MKAYLQFVKLMLPFVKITIFLNRKMNLNNKFGQKKKGEKDIFGQFCANFYARRTYILFWLLFSFAIPVFFLILLFYVKIVKVILGSSPSRKINLPEKSFHLML